MANSLYYSNLNPVKLYLPAPDTTFNTRHIDDFEFFDTIEEWQEHKDYLQPFKPTDHIHLQLMADFGPHSIKVLNIYGQAVLTVNFTLVLTNPDQPTLQVYELDLDLSSLPTGTYRLQYSGGIDTPLILQSNRIDVCTSHKKSIVLNYAHTQYHQGVFFETGIRFQLRIEGSLKYKSPASKDEDFEDQTLDDSLLQSIPYRLYELTIGDEAGVPDDKIDMVNFAFTCPDMLIDGKKYTRPAGNKFERNEVEGWAAKGWKVEVRQSVNRPSLVYQNNQPQNARVGIVINADSKGFGNDTGGTMNQITDVQ